MASWNDLDGYIRQNYPIAEEGADLFVLVFRMPFDQDRTQMVRIQKESAMSGEEWAHITSPVGRLGEIDIGALLKECGETGRGGLAAIGEVAVLRHSIHLPSFDLGGLRTALTATAMAADFAELRLAGGDEF